MIIAVLLITFAILAAPLLELVRFRNPPPKISAEWRPHVRMLCTSLTLMDGSVTRSAYLMRRRSSDGKWQYRQMTEQEFELYVDRPWP